MSQQGLEVFAKRVRFDVHDLEAVCLNPKIVTFTPKSRVDQFTLEERLLDRPNPSGQCILAPQGELINSNFAFSCCSLQNQIMLCFYCYGQGGGPYQAPNLPMKILGWNCRGICNAATVRTLKAHIKGNSLCIVFLSETKAFVNRTKEVLRLIIFF